MWESLRPFPADEQDTAVVSSENVELAYGGSAVSTKLPADAEPTSVHPSARPRGTGAAARDPGQARADDPFPRRQQREDGLQGPRHAREDRRPAREPRGRDTRRPQGGRARGPDRAREVDRV